MSPDHQIPEIVLERYRLGELPAADAARIAALAGGDPAVRERLGAIERSDAEFVARELGRRLEDEVRRQLGARKGAGGWGLGASRWPGAGWGLAAVAAAAAILFAVVPRGVVRQDAPIAVPVGTDDGDRIKGLRPALALYRRTADGSETLADGAVARAGDLLRIGYRAAGRPYGVILSVDGRGSVTVHLPDAAERAVPLRRDATVLLDRAYELDDAPNWERFYFVSGHEPFAIAPLVDAARRVAASGRGTPPAALPLPPGFEQSSVSIQKETTP
jgi:hypothetical protein